MTDGEKLAQLDKEYVEIVEKLYESAKDVNTTIARDTINLCQQLVRVCEEMNYLEHHINRTAMNMRI